MTGSDWTPTDFDVDFDFDSNLRRRVAVAVAVAVAKEERYQSIPTDGDADTDARNDELSFQGQVRGSVLGSRDASGIDGADPQGSFGDAAYAHARLERAGGG